MNGCESRRDMWKGQEEKSSYRERGRERCVWGGSQTKTTSRRKSFSWLNSFRGSVPTWLGKHGNREGQHGSRSRKVTDSKHSYSRNRKRTELGPGYKPSKLTSSDKLLPAKLPFPVLTTSPNITTTWEPSVQVHEPRRDISHLDHRTIPV